MELSEVSFFKKKIPTAEDKPNPRLLYYVSLHPKRLLNLIPYHSHCNNRLLVIAVAHRRSYRPSEGISPADPERRILVNVDLVNYVVIDYQRLALLISFFALT